MYCKKCGTKYKEGQIYCVNCGVNLNQQFRNNKVLELKNAKVDNKLNIMAILNIALLVSYAFRLLISICGIPAFIGENQIIDISLMFENTSIAYKELINYSYIEIGLMILLFILSILICIYLYDFKKNADNLQKKFNNFKKVNILVNISLLMIISYAAFDGYICYKTILFFRLFGKELSILGILSYILTALFLFLTIYVKILFTKIKKIIKINSVDLL